MSRSRHLRSPSPPRGGRSSRRAAGVRSAWSALLLGLAMVAPSGAADIVGSDASDNNSYTFPEWRSQLTGTPEDDEIFGLQGHDLLFGRGGRDRLHGGPGNDRLFGEAGDDHLFGGVGGVDEMHGGPGNDTFLAVDPLDDIRERAGEGMDTVLAFVDFTLPANVEKLFLRPNTIVGGNLSDPSVTFHEDCSRYAGSLPCHQLGSVARGNGLDNEIRGNQMDNRLYGEGGHDLLYGFAGHDELEGGTGNDVLAGFLMDGRWASVEFDVLRGGSGADLFVIGLSGRPGGLPISAATLSRERFPQYLGQGMVYIMDFDWEQGDKIEVFGNVADYWVELGTTPWLGSHAAIYWNGSAYGFSSRELVGYAMGIASAGDLIPIHDFL